MSLSLNTKRRRDAEWLLDWVRNVEAYGISYTQYEAYRLRHGRTPPKAETGKGRTSPRHRATTPPKKGSAA